MRGLEWSRRLWTPVPSSVDTLRQPDDDAKAGLGLFLQQLRLKAVRRLPITFAG